MTLEIEFPGNPRIPGESRNQILNKNKPNKIQSFDEYIYCSRNSIEFFFKFIFYGKNMKGRSKDSFTHTQ